MSALSGAVRAGFIFQRMTERYALADLAARRWDDDALVEGDREDVANLAGLLARVRFAWSCFTSVFTFSESDFRTGLIRREPWAKAMRWLTSLEDMVRGVLLMMALAMPATAAMAKRPSRMRMRAPAAPCVPETPLEPSPAAASEPEHPCDYPNVSLSVVSWLIAPEASGPKAARANAARGWRLANRWHRIRGLVCRTEALLRILNDPAPFAQRVARRLQGMNRPLRFPHYPPPREAPLVGRNGGFPEPRPPTPYRDILAPLWTYLAGVVSAREQPG
jgi:hypothetical protein